MLLLTTLEALKASNNPSCDSATSPLTRVCIRTPQGQRDLYVATRDLFSRHDRLSGDQVERIKKRVETASLRLEGIKSAKKDGWAEEADKIISTIERDQASISMLLSRRVFTRHRCADPHRS